MYLGRRYSISGNVVKGKGLGKKFGFRTANISVNSNLILPKSGVYFTKCIIDNSIYYSVTNIGRNPTVEKNKDFISIETHILNFSKNIYGKKIEIFFYHKSRDEHKYSCVDDLIKQVNQDIELAKQFFEI